MNSTTTQNRALPKLVILISGGGTNLQAFIDKAGSEELPAHIVGVVSNRPGVKGLERAALAGIPSTVVDHTEYESREVFDEALREAVNRFAPDLVILAGFMRILTPVFVDHYAGRLMNIHPSLLPKYPGLNTHQRALDAGDLEAGATVHFVTSELDGGPPIVQAKVPIKKGDTAEILATRVLEKEHLIYPLAAKWFSQGRLSMANNRVLFDGQTVPDSGIPFENQ
ncbi:MAG: phosphoribosylglycinamide formyltransferase [bacterium]